MMKVLHICHDFPGSKVHRNLYQELENLGVTQFVYTYFDKDKYFGRNYFKSGTVQIIYSKILSKYDRLFYHYKIYKVYKDVKSKIELGDVDIIHAATLFSDGGVAYQIYKERHTPYIVSVRNTDVNLFLKMMPHTWQSCKTILKNAHAIVFVSEAMKEQFQSNRFITSFYKEIQNKIIVQPNGIDDFWIDNVQKRMCVNHNIVYVGVYDKNKNVIKLIKAIKNLSIEYPDIKLTLVGGRGNLKEKIKRISVNHPKLIVFKGLITDRNELLKIYRQNSIFAMPSFHETFGLVYLEAMSQGLACLYTKGQGIDQMFSDKIGKAVNPHSLKDIINGLDEILKHRDEYCTDEINFNSFRWCNIALSYRNLYFSILSSIKQAEAHEDC